MLTTARTGFAKPARLIDALPAGALDAEVAFEDRTCRRSAREDSPSAHA